MISKAINIIAILRKVDKEDIVALKEFVIVLKENGKSIVGAVRVIKNELDSLVDELQD